MRAALIVAAAAAVTVGLLWWSWQSFGPESIAFAFLVVWVPMAALGTASHFVTIRLPERCHRLRGWELRSRVYELLGVRVAKRMLRRGPLSVFNPHLHLPPTPDAARVVALDARMREAEASHAVLFVLEVAVAMHAVARGWWPAALCTLAFDIIMNAYPAMLQRYNRALLRRRFGAVDPPTGG